MKSKTQIFLLFTAILFSFFISQPVFGQITPPGYEREMEEMKHSAKTNALDRDSVRLVDHVSIVDVDTGAETLKTIITTKSLRDYCQHWLGIQNPDKLLDGKPLKIVNPSTYEEMTVRLNLQTSKIDTIGN